MANKIFAKLYHKSTGWNGKDFTGPVQSIPMCGSDSEIYLDARKSLTNQQIDVTEAIAKHRNKDSITGYQIFYRASSIMYPHRPIGRYQRLQDFNLSEDAAKEVAA